MSKKRAYQASRYNNNYSSNNYNNNNNNRGSSGGGFGLGGILLIIALVIGVYNNQKGIIPTQEIKQTFSSEQVVESSSQDEGINRPAWEGYSQTGGATETTLPDDPQYTEATEDYTTLIYRLHTEYLRTRSLAGGQGDELVSSLEEPVSGGQGVVYYKNCGEVIAQGKAPLTQDEPGYRLALDTNKDGVACEG